MLFTLASVAAALLSLFFIRKRSNGWLARVIFALGILLVTISNLFFLIADYFSGNGIDESVYYHLNYGLQGAGYQEHWWIIISAAAALITSFILAFWLIGGKKKAKTGRSYFPVALLLLAIIVSPGIATTAPQFIYAATGGDDFDQYYRQPEITAKPDQPKNLIFIYAESLERTYFDETAFPGLIKDLRQLENQGTTFTNIDQAGNTGWTVAGMVASHCGIPLVSSSSSNSMSGMSTFLSGATCLGDLLEQEGYNLHFFGGADLEFAGKGKFLTTHKIIPHGKAELLPQLADPEYITPWGIHDDSLIDITWPQLEKIAESSDPFAIFLLTLDTHHPNGLPSKSCDHLKYQDGKNQILNAVACSDFLIAQYIEQIKNSPLADNTIIVLASDHLALNNTATDQLERLNRRNTFIIIDPSKDIPRTIDAQGTTLDIGPTVLKALGYEAQIGLGRNLFTEKSLHSELENLNRSLNGWRTEIASFWDFPKITSDIAINPETKTATIEGAEYQIPLLLEIDQDYQSTIRFDFGISPKRKKLLEYYLEADPNKALIWIDECYDLKLGDKHNSYRGNLCLNLRSANGPVIFNSVIDQASVLPFSYIQRAQNNSSKEGSNNFTPWRIAHAGGGLNDKTYTNSMEALDYNINRGYRYFEIDLTFTSDNKLVCMHDWEEAYKRNFGLEPNGIPSFSEFQTTVKEHGKYTPCHLDRLKNWLILNPSAKIITDVRGDNLAALRKISETIKDAGERVIPQIYKPSSFEAVKEMGYQQVIWTLYRHGGTENTILEQAKKLDGDFAITMPSSQARSFLPKRLREHGIPTYVHTINSPTETSQYFKQYQLSEVYTDTLDPLTPLSER